MKTIHKYPTPLQPKFTIMMPQGAEILTVQMQDNDPYIWALVETDNEPEDRHFELYGTGFKIHEDMGINRKYIGTYQIEKGAFVGHLFERID